MLKFLRAGLAVWSGLAILCLGAVALGRFIHTPDVLESLGFDLCNGDPCFEGIKPGTEWNHTSRSLPSLAGNVQIQIQTVPNGASVAALIVSYTDFEQSLPLGTAGIVLERYGPPCRIELADSRIGSSFYLIYPGLDVLAQGGSPFNPDGYRLQVTSPVLSIRLIRHDGFWACDAPQTPVSGDWHGFINASKYADYFLKASSSPERK